MKTSLVWSVRRAVAMVSGTAIAVLAYGGCGGGGSSGGSKKANCPTLTIASSTPLNQLTAAQVAELCDWGACMLGGYGATLSCSTGSAATVAMSQQDCVNSGMSLGASCTATVEDQIECTDAVSANGCASTAFSNAGCAAVIDCEF